jgi:hypothetical protein
VRIADTARAVLSAAARWGPDFEGSTRPAALLRLGLAGLVWTRFARSLCLFKCANPDHVVIAACFFVFTPLMTVGRFSRLATAGTGLTLLACYYHLGMALGHDGFVHHHTYLLASATLLLALTPCGRSLSWDRLAALRAEARGGPPAPPERGPLWGQRLIALQVSMVYLWGAWDKAISNPAFLSGDALEYSLHWIYLGSDSPTWRGLPQLSAAAARGTVLLEVALGAGLFFRSLRRWLIPAGLVFHAIIYYTLPVSTFSMTMALLYLAFLDPDAVHRALDRLVAGPSEARP